MMLTLEPVERNNAQWLQECAQACADQTLGRLARRVSHAAVSLRRHERAAGRTVHACTLRLRVPGTTDIIVESLKPEPGAAVAVAFKHARHALIHRRRNKSGRALGWHRHPAPAAA